MGKLQGLARPLRSAHQPRDNLYNKSDWLGLTATSMGRVVRESQVQVQEETLDEAARTAVPDKEPLLDAINGGHGDHPRQPLLHTSELSATVMPITTTVVHQPPVLNDAVGHTSAPVPSQMSKQNIPTEKITIQRPLPQGRKARWLYHNPGNG